VLRGYKGYKKQQKGRKILRHQNQRACEQKSKENTIRPKAETTEAAKHQTKNKSSNLQNAGHQPNSRSNYNEV
jgi:hypothetical protein